MWQKRNPGSCLPQTAKEGIPRSTIKNYIRFPRTASMNHSFFQQIETILAPERLDAYRRDGVSPATTLARYLWNVPTRYMDYFTPKACTATAQGESRRNPGKCAIHRDRRPNGADPTPIDLSSIHRPNGCAPLGRGMFRSRLPRVAPWAITVGSVGARPTHVAKTKMSIKANLRRVGL
jgi:hypothetical protein